LLGQADGDPHNPLILLHLMLHQIKELLPVLYGFMKHTEFHLPILLIIGQTLSIAIGD
jgi:hypothetical protein